MIIKDGDTYRFSHRSFQTYFAAYYTARSLTDEQQKRLFAQILSGLGTYWKQGDYYTLLLQIEPERFAENALKDRLRQLFLTAQTVQHPNEFFLRRVCSGVTIHSVPEDEQRNTTTISYRVAYSNGSCYDFNVLALFRKYSKHIPPEHDMTFNANKEAIMHYICRICPLKPDISFNKETQKVFRASLTFEKIDASDLITEDERQDLYRLIIQSQWINGIYDHISQWLNRLNAKRASLKSPSFIDDL